MNVQNFIKGDMLMSKYGFSRKFSVALACIMSLGTSFNSNAFMFQDGKLKILDSATTAIGDHIVNLKEYKQLNGMGLKLYRIPKGELVYINMLGQGEKSEDGSMKVFKLDNPSAKELETIPEHPLIKRLENAAKRGDKLYFLPMKDDPRLSLLVQREPDGNKKIVCFTEHLSFRGKTLETTKVLSAEEFKNSFKNKNSVDEKYFVTENLKEFVEKPDADILSWAKNNKLDSSLELSGNNSSSSGYVGMSLGMTVILLSFLGICAAEDVL